jgi:hypothetical protein
MYKSGGSNSAITVHPIAQFFILESRLNLTAYKPSLGFCRVMITIGLVAYMSKKNQAHNQCDCTGENVDSLSDHSIRDALIRLLNRKASDIPPCSTADADAFASVLLAKALRGNLKAAREIVDRVEGKALEWSMEDASLSRQSYWEEVSMRECHSQDYFITEALTRLLNGKVSDIPPCRTSADAFARGLFVKAFRGDVGAAREISNRVQGKVSQRSMEDAS